MSEEEALLHREVAEFHLNRAAEIERALESTTAQAQAAEGSSERAQVDLPDQAAESAGEKQDGLPGWTVKRVPRPDGKKRDKYFFTPKEKLKFKVLSRAKEFQEILEKGESDELKAYRKFRKEWKHKAI